MSSEVTVILAAPTIALIDVVFCIERGLAKIGYRHGSDIFRVDLSDMPGLSNHTEIDVPFAASQQGGIAGWLALSMSFFSDALGLNIAVHQRNPQYTNVYIDVSTSILRHKERIELFRLFILAVVDIARSVRAFGGVGGAAFDVDKIAPDMLLAAIVNNPCNVGFPSDIGLVEVSGMGESAINSMAGSSFKVEALDGYWLLLGNDFMELLEAD